MSAQPSLLIVDDEQGILDTLRILLKNEGFDVVTAQGGKAGLEQLKASAPEMRSGLPRRAAHCSKRAHAIRSRLRSRIVRG